MKTLTQKTIFKKISGETEESTAMHIYSECGHFEKSGIPCGWHIQIGTSDSVESYVEVDDGIERSVPESLPDIIAEEEIEETQDMTPDILYEAIREVINS